MMIRIWENCYTIILALKLSAKQAMEALNIPLAEQDKYMSRL